MSENTKPRNPLEIFCEGVCEVRVLKSDAYKTTYSGYFDDLNAAFAEAGRYDGLGNVYFVLNPVTHDVMSRRCAGKIVKVGQGETTKDADITMRHWLLFDFDPERASGISATDEEKAAALAVMENASRVLALHGFRPPVVCDSGNGYHLLYRVDLPNDAEAAKLVKSVLGAASLLFSTEGVKVDRQVFNAARITKFYGSMAVKGRSTDERPHRRSSILAVPEQIETTPANVLEDFVKAYMPEPPKREYAQRSGGREFDLDRWLDEHGVRIRDRVQTSDGTRYVLEDGCPFNPEHKGKDAVIFKHQGGGIGFKCFHNSCADRRWKDFRLLFEPDAYDKGYRPTAREAFSDGYQNPIPEHPPDKLPQSVKMIRMDTVKSTPTKWLWYPYIPSGKLTLMQGDPGQGKTMLSLAIAAKVSCGGSYINDEPGVQRPPGVVIYQTAEDGLADTIKPRLEKMDPTLSNIFVIDEAEQGLTLTDERIQAAMEEYDPRLLIIDPLQAYLGADVDMHRANEVRPVLSRIAHLAEQHNCAVLLIMHMSKMTTAKALYRGLGSIDIPAAARSILVVGRNPEDPDQKIMAHEKSSLARNGQSVAFRIDADRGIVFDGFSDLCADQILNIEPQKRGRPAGAGIDAKEFVRNYLEEHGGFARKNDIVREAAEWGLSGSSLQRARVLLDLGSFQSGYGTNKGSWWMLPGITRAQVEAENHLHEEQEAVLQTKL